MNATAAMVRLLIPLALFALVLSGAQSTPQFSAAGVARGDRSVDTLVPGAAMSIYGRNLGHACNLNACDTQVWIGTREAELLYVSETQVNFQVPFDVAASESAPLRVVVAGQSSAAVAMRVGVEKPTGRVEGPAYTDGPVWLNLILPFEKRNGSKYPFVLGDANFGCYQVEVRKDGVLLKHAPASYWTFGPLVFSGNACGSYLSPGEGSNRLPLHLLYRFDTPGLYEVRYSVGQFPFPSPRSEIRLLSVWISFEVLPQRRNWRANWLNTLSAQAPSDRAEMLSNVLPSVLGHPEEVTLAFVIAYLYHPDKTVRLLASEGLRFWPKEEALRKLADASKVKGVTDQVTRLLSIPHP